MNFPSTPNIGQIYNLGDYTWQWNGAGWEVLQVTGVGGTLVVINMMYRTYEYGYNMPAVSFDIT